MRKLKIVIEYTDGEIETIIGETSSVSAEGFLVIGYKDNLPADHIGLIGKAINLDGVTNYTLEFIEQSDES